MKTKTKTMSNQSERQSSASGSGIAPPTVARRYWLQLLFSILLGSIVGLAACTHPTSNTKVLRDALDRAQQTDVGAIEMAPESPSATEIVPNITPSLAPATHDQSEMVLGSETFIASGIVRSSSRDTVDNEGIILNFQAADIQEVVKAILGDILGENYIIEQGVSGTVTTETSGGLNKSDLLPILEMLLRQSQAALIKDGTVYRIVPIATAIKGTISPTTANQQRDPSYGMQIVTLRYIAVNELQKIIEPILNDGALIYADERRNLLILGGTPGEQRHYLETIAIFDVDWMKGMSIGLFRLDFVEPEQLVKELEQSLGGESGKLLDGLVRLVAFERLSSLLVVSPSRAALTEVKTWIDRLDVPSDTSDPRLYVLRLQNSKAADVAAILNDVFSGGDATPFRDRQIDLAPGLRPTTVASEPSTTAAEPSARTSIASSGIVFRSSENIRIIPDETNNSLVILATPREYEIIRAAVLKLDVVPLQVLIEATILEVTLSDSLEFGVEWFFKNGLAGDKQGQGLLDLGAAGIGTLAPAFSYAIIDSADQVRAAINALATESEVKILSSPSLMVLDNQSATITVGDEIPIPTRSSISNIDSNAPIVNEIAYRNTGVTLQVTPRVNAGGLVIMEVDQEVSDAVATTSSDINAPTIQQRRITTTVAVQSGDTVVLGGLIRDSATQSASGVPYLRNIPILGKLFGQTNDTTRRTELIVLITPRAVSNGAEARNITREYSKKMKNFDPPKRRELHY
ncbi:MAG: type II secretion system protein GspD [Proteobacteria bacterium]|nr:MAG: type II secretion system protein GspD [Pseudomonadota bacterium]